MDGPVHPDVSVPIVNNAREDVDMATRRHPDVDCGTVRPWIPLLDDRSHDEAFAKIVLIGFAVRLIPDREPPIQGLQKRLVLQRRADAHRVQVRQQTVAEPQELLHHGRALGPVQPRFLGRELAVGGMQPHDRGEDAELYPAGRELVVARPAHVSANVVAPPSVADVGSGAGKLGLELERGPAHDAVA